MPRLILLLAGTALIAAVALGFAGWRWLEPRLHGPPRPVTADRVFQAINPEREFVDLMTHHLLSRPDIRAAMQISPDSGLGTSPPLDLAAHSNLLIVLAVSQRISHTLKLDEALTAACDHFMDRYYDLGRREWRDDFVAAGPLDAPMLITVSRAMIALSLAYDVTGNQRQLIAAQSIWAKHRAFLLPPAVLGDTLRPQRQPIDSATLVAAFDALVVLYEVAGGSTLSNDIEDMARYIVRDIMDRSGGILATTYAPTLEPLPGPQLPPAGQLTMAAALATAAEQGLSALFVAPGSDLMDMVIGGRPAKDTASYTAADHIEAARAIALYASRKDRTDLWPAFDEHYNALRASLTPAAEPDILARTARFYLAQRRLNLPVR